LPAPTGSVQFFDGANLLGSGTVSGGQTSYTTSALTGGNHTIVARYSGDSTWPSAQGAYAQSVSAPVTLTAMASPTAAVYGQAVTLTANVSATVPAGFTAPTGQVTFSLPNSTLFAPRILLGTAALASGTAAVSVNAIPLGTQTVTAFYSGDSTWPSAIGTFPVTVSQASTSTAVGLSTAAGQLVLSAVVAAAPPGAGTPTGSVQFVNVVENNKVVASGALVGGKASATIAASATNTVLGWPIAAVYSGDASFKPSTSATLPAVVNGGVLGYSGSFSANEITSLFGITGLSGDTPGTQPLGTSLGGVTVTITDSAGASRQALLFGVFQSTGQISLMIPSGTAAGLAAVTITLPGGGTITTAIDITVTAPGIFTANANGQGPYAGQVIYVSANGSQTVDSAAVLNGATYVPNPINLSIPGGQVYLVLYGTGMRNASTLTAAVNGVSVPVAYYGAQGSYDGLDQVNLGPLPASLAGSGVVNLVVTADGLAANAVTVEFQ
jgi:uncharacterized protein (TIGR03437 family)